MNKRDVEKLLYQHFYDHEKNVVDLRGLDFSRFHCGVNISGMEVCGDLIQGDQTATGNILQGGCTAGGEIDQTDQMAREVKW